MDNTGTIILLSLAMLGAMLLIVGGLILLNKQILIKDSVTGKISEVELPVFGKIKTNYPSLIAIFLGPAIIFYVVGRLPSLEPETFLISGQFTANDSSVYNEAKVVIAPQGYTEGINDDGTFTIKVPKHIKTMPYNAYVTYKNSNGVKDYKKATVKERNNVGLIQLNLR